MRIILSILLTGFLIAVDYETEIQPIFNANCIDCHGGSGGLTLTSYSDLMGNDVVIPGNSADSQLIRKLRGTASGSPMPENQDPLDETTITLIETWIDEGALENEVYGCTDPEACNYDDTSTNDDGCEYTSCDGTLLVPSEYSTIQSAIDVASEGDSVIVAAGTYVENIVWVETNGIKLIGSGEGDCFIDGDSLASVIRFEEDLSGIIDSTTLITGFTIQNGYAKGDWPNNCGGGMYLSYSSPSLVNVMISGNSAEYGGGIYCENSSSPTLKNVTITNNSAEYGGGIYSKIGDNNPSLVNCILSNNLPNEIDGSATVIYSNIEGGWLGDGNIDADPQFVNSDNENYSLQEDSPCIDTGISDLDGDGNDDITNYCGYAPDMGAYEYCLGCMDETACNYNETAREDDNSCTYAEENYDCDGNCTALDECGVCGGNGVDADDDGVCDDVDDCVVEDGASQECGCNTGIAEGACDCAGNVDDCAGVCGGDGPTDGFDCDGNQLSLFNGLIPKNFSIHSIYPNPFNPVTNIIYGLPEHVNVQIIVYDLSGKQVESLISEFQTPGYHSVNWDADNLPSGVYLIRMDSGDFTQTQKVVLVK